MRGVVTSLHRSTWVRSFPPRKATENQRAVSPPSNTSQLNRSESALNCWSDTPAIESTHTRTTGIRREVLTSPRSDH